MVSLCHNGRKVAKDAEKKQEFGLVGFEGEAAGRFSNMLIGSAGVFSATKRTKGVDFA
jgi:hypothetical protein